MTNSHDIDRRELNLREIRKGGGSQVGDRIIINGRPYVISKLPDDTSILPNILTGD